MTIDNILSIFVAQHFNKKMVNYLTGTNKVFLTGLSFIILYNIFNNITWLFHGIISKLTVATILKIQYKIRNNLFRYTIQHSMKYFNDSFSGAIANKISSITNKSGRFLKLTCKIFEKTITILLTPILYAQINFYLGMLFLFIAIAFMIASRKIRKNVIHESNYLAEEKSKYSALINDDIMNIINIKIFSKIFSEKLRIKKQATKILRKDYNFQEADKNFYVMVFVFSFLFYAIILLFSCIALYLKKINIGDFIYLTIVTSILNHTTRHIVDITSEYSELKGTLENGLNAIFQPIEIVNNNNRKEIIVKKGKITFKNIIFYYEK